MQYADYQHLLFDSRPNGVLVLTLNRPEALNATNKQMHFELAEVWKTVAADPAVKVVLVTGAGEAFSRGGEIDVLSEVLDSPALAAAMIKEAGDIVYNMAHLDTPIVSAINGLAIGAGLAVALMADISIMAEDARLTDGHVRIGVSAGDHAAMIWPLLCGMAKAKYYLLTADYIDGKEAERIGLVSLCRPADEVLPKAFEVANKLAAGSQMAIRYTKRSLNNWLRQAGPIFDNSLALELMCFLNPDAREGVTALSQGRIPAFPSAMEHGAVAMDAGSAADVFADWSQFYKGVFGVDIDFTSQAMPAGGGEAQ